MVTARLRARASLAPRAGNRGEGAAGITLYASPRNSAYTVWQMNGSSVIIKDGCSPDMPADGEDPWREFDAELEAWGHAGLTAAFWWRDDDATRPGPLLDRLLAAAGPTPIALAVIPATAEDSLAGRLAAHNRGVGEALVLQHGHAHLNHAPPTEKKAEFGDHRPLEVMLDELATGRQRLETLFGETFEPILTPPWNRAGDEVIRNLARSGLQGLSRFGPRGPAEGDRVVNTHIDIVDWRGGRGFVGERQALRAAVEHLAARRTGATDKAEPTGLLTHHRDHDEACWRFIAKFVAAVDAHPAARWVAP